MTRHIYLMSGSVINLPSLYAFMYSQGFAYTLWITEKDFNFLRNSYPFEQKKVALCYSGPVFSIETSCTHKTLRYINIQQFSHPLAVFEYYLYHRQFTEDGCVLSVENQFRAHEASEKYNFRWNFWVTEGFLCEMNRRPADFPQKYTPLPLSSRRQLTSKPVPRYNIGQFESPDYLKRLVTMRAYSVVAARGYPYSMSRQLIESMRLRGYEAQFWFEASEQRSIHRVGAKLKDDEIPVTVLDSETRSRFFFNIEQTTEPLFLQRMFCVSRIISQMCIEAITRQPLPLKVAQAMILWRHRRNFFSRFCIQKTDLALLGAILKEGDHDDGFHINGIVYFNFDQIENPREIWRNIDNLRQSFNNECIESNALDILDRILAE